VVGVCRRLGPELMEHSNPELSKGMSRRDERHGLTHTYLSGHFMGCVVGVQSA
jgi:hypothetical protein